MKYKWLLLPLLTLFFVACDDEVSYSDMKDREARAVKEFIRSEGINVISYKDFIANDSTTDVENNEYVLIDDVYMQIVRNPKNVEGARRMRDEETLNVMARFYEYNISDADTLLGNIFDSDNPDYMRIKYSHGSYSATFTSGYMSITYGSAVPTGWLTPLPYIYFTRRQSQTAKVRLIVPHTKGTSTASSYVYPCFYEITFIPENLYDTD
ncbi:MAG: DUF4827 domain-containing protein [Bacteroidaceae bacterium]|nr:DUF4827 domain-containing protein [Bacteroidaceae bacterium]